MEFSKIRYKSGEGVELMLRLKMDGGAGEARTFTCATPPLPEFVAALAAFKPFVLGLVPIRNETIYNEDGTKSLLLDSLVITTLSVDEEPKTHRVGLIVTALLPIADANNRPLVINTPRMREWEDDGSDKPKGAFGEDIVKLITAAQEAATRYYRGERGQTEMFTTDDTTKKSAESAAEQTNGTDPAKPPRVRRQRRVKEIEGAGRVENPEATIPPTDEVIHKQLAISGFIVPLGRLAKWVSSEREEALKWALDPEGSVAPYCVRRDAEHAEMATSAGE